ncbi:hypothetical protein [Nocardiopsis halotolerans]|uniref:hypothetical protein n=1 Tax=Nocardiopsis halotolerans TaxID=124252 RepID=UPI0003456552|nr:hypothetical protein [Nocardiopsis halotolerans]
MPKLARPGGPPLSRRPGTGPRYQAARWLGLRRWLDRNPEDGLAARVRARLTTGPARYTRYQWEHLGWGVFALMGR